MKKQIVLLSENENENFFEYAKAIVADTDFEIISAKADVNKYDAVIFVFEKNPHNRCQRLNSWVGHNHLRAVWGDGDEAKKEMLCKELMHIAGTPLPLEIERKFLIEYPDINMLESSDNCKAVEIEQIYLSPEQKAHVRIRRRSVCGEDIYIKTQKEKISDTVRIETEEKITKEQYVAYSSYEDKELAPICKTRYCLMHNGRYFEIDVFPFWKDKAYMEIELTHEEEKVVLPEFIKVIKEVTTDGRYTNRALAKLLRQGKTDEL